MGNAFPTPCHAQAAIRISNVLVSLVQSIISALVWAVPIVNAVQIPRLVHIAMAKLAPRIQTVLLAHASMAFALVSAILHLLTPNAMAIFVKLTHNAMDESV